MGRVTQAGTRRGAISNGVNAQIGGDAKGGSERLIECLSAYRQRARVLMHRHIVCLEAPGGA